MSLKSTVLGETLFRIHGRAGDPYFDNVSTWAQSNEFLIHAVGRYIQPGSVIFDIGANIGLTTCMFSKVASQTRVFSFEPSPEAFGYLTQTIAENALENVAAHQFAFGAQSGSISFTVNAFSGAASHLAPAGKSLGQGNTLVEVQDLNSFIEREKISRLDFIKIDVEGFELDVLEGGVEALKRLRPIVFLEFNSFTLIAYGNRNPRALLEYLIDNFPFVYRFETGRLLPIRSEAEQLSFIHDNLIHRCCVDDLICSFGELT
ncbi:MAG: FkbM family methyltransferase [Acetobacteraceae bacterium]|jgi:FkbM family methyltransferase|nr:FkbM family methyltransferase [Roseomonas sp.]